MDEDYTLQLEFLESQMNAANQDVLTQDVSFDDDSRRQLEQLQLFEEREAEKVARLENMLVSMFFSWASSLAALEAKGLEGLTRSPICDQIESLVRPFSLAILSMTVLNSLRLIDILKKFLCYKYLFSYVMLTCFRKPLMFLFFEIFIPKNGCFFTCPNGRYFFCFFS